MYGVKSQRKQRWTVQAVSYTHLDHDQRRGEEDQEQRGSPSGLEGFGTLPQLRLGGGVKGVLLQSVPGLLREMCIRDRLYTVCSLVIINLLGNFDLHVLTALFGAFLIALAAYFLLFAKRVPKRIGHGNRKSVRRLPSAYSGCGR